MPDITMCSGDGCPLKRNCYRYKATPTPFWQSYFTNPPVIDGECEYFIKEPIRYGKMQRDKLPPDKKLQ